MRYPFHHLVLQRAAESVGRDGAQYTRYAATSAWEGHSSSWGIFFAVTSMSLGNHGRNDELPVAARLHALSSRDGSARLVNARRFPSFSSGSAARDLQRG